VNDALCRMLGRPREWLRSHTFSDVTHADDLAREASVTRGLREGAFDHTQYEKRYLHADGHVVHALVSKSVVRGEDGDVHHFHLQAVDVTEQRDEAQRSRRRARQQAAVAAIGQRALDGAPLPELFDECVVAIQDTLRVPLAGVSELMPGGALVMRAARGYAADRKTASDPATSQSGLSLALGAPVIMDDSETETRFEPVFAREDGARSGITVPIPAPGGTYFGLLLAHSDRPRFFEADDLSFLQALANVLAGALGREAAEGALRHQSLHDALTGLPNRVLLLDRLGHALERAQRTDEALAIMFLDVDHFKTVNDAFGHDAGDELLRALTPRLHEALRSGDTLARFGGDEFVVLCEGLEDGDSAMALAERLLGVFAEPFVLGEAGGHRSEHHLSASIGVALAGPEHCGDPAALIRDADIAMYRAKQVRGRVELFDQSSRTRLVERVRTAGELRRAIDGDELAIVYQPQVDLIDGSVSGLEALLRWRHPERGLVTPADFIPVAEESGLIVPMGEWILDAVLDQLAVWDAEGDPLLAGMRCGVNLSARQLVERWLPEQVSAALERHAVEPSRLVCEITETALIGDPARAAENVEALVACGVSVALDDFCTGYSALEHLKRFSLAEIKLDRTFVADLATSAVDMAVVRGLVEMAGAMDLTTVAEGVETPDQLARLRELGCDRAQGYLFSAGLGAGELAELLRELPRGRFDLERIHVRSSIAA
ncbi:MAG TPA: EAL domain-containing protein, partial [Solirubrobacteraceae bacterium]|nr:EAL domain-containing protein [Solirubrobacteraceae bacterium]